MAEKPVPEPAAERWVSYMREAFPEGRTDIALIPQDMDRSTLTCDTWR